MTAPHAAQIIDGYLARLEAELAHMRPAERAELMADITTHISEARASMTEETDAALLTLIDRLGDPAVVAAEGRARLGPEPPAPVSAGWLERLALLALIMVWPAGVVLLWLSEVWTTRDKLIGTLVPPGGYPFLIFGLPILLLRTSYSCSRSGTVDAQGHEITIRSTCPSDWVMTLWAVGGLVVLLVLLALPILSAIYLARRARLAGRAGGSLPAPT